MTNYDSTDWDASIGLKADIVNGDVVLSDDGFLTVSKSVAPYVALVQDHKPVPICPPTEYRGRHYRFMRSDCATLAAEWLDNNLGTSILPKVVGRVGRTYQALSRFGYEDIVTGELGFAPATDAQHGDMIIYETPGHVGICIDGQKILHHLGRKYSSLDVLDGTKILKVFRYAK